MVVGQSVVDSVEQRLSGEDDLSHLIHSSLHTGAVVLGKGLESGVAGNLVGGVEPAGVGLDLREVAEAAPLPVGGNVSAENTVPGLLEGGELVTEEAMELRASALEHGQVLDGRLNVDAPALVDINLDIAGLTTLLDERVRVRLAINVHAHPAVGNNVDVSGVDVTVLLDEVRAEDGAEQLRGSNGLLLGGDVDSVLDGVGSDDNTVVGLSVAVNRFC